MFFSSNGYQPCPTHSEGWKRGTIRELEICSGHCCDTAPVKGAPGFCAISLEVLELFGPEM